MAVRPKARDQRALQPLQKEIHRAPPIQRDGSGSLGDR